MHRIPFRLINFMAILFLIAGFCIECRLLYLGTYILIISEIMSHGILLRWLFEKPDRGLEYYEGIEFRKPPRRGQ